MRVGNSHDIPFNATSVKTPKASRHEDIAQYEQACVFHHQGKLDEAENLYRALLGKHPQNVDLLHRLGTAQGQRNNFTLAIEFFEQALSVDPNNAAARSALGNCLKSLGKLTEALATYDLALALAPSDANVLNNRGATLRDLNRLEDALKSLDQALAVDPNHIVALDNRGMTLRELKRFTDALASHDKALAISPNYASAYYNRGNVLWDLKRHEDARTSYEQALALNPENSNALSNIGMTLATLGRHEEALVSCDRALGINPDDPVALCTRGIALDGLKRYDDALLSYDRAMMFKPDYVDAFNNRGVALKALKRHTEALSSYEKGLSINPDHLPSRFNRGMLLLHAKRAEEAARDFERLVNIDPDYEFARGYLLHAKMSCCDWNGLSDIAAQIDNGVQRRHKSSEPFCYLPISRSPANLMRCAEICLANHLLLSNESWAFPPPGHAKKIRLGYVAGEFREHATSYLLAELLERHDLSRFELFAFDNGWDDKSDIRNRLERSFSEIIDISRLSDADAVTKIKNLAIDILIDLNGHVGLKRTGVFSHKPAPIQVNWLGFPGTMGSPFMDYIIGDATVIPAGHEIHYSEKVVRLPDTYQVNDSRRTIAERTPTRGEANLPDAGFVFCCFNNNFKITPDVFDIWMRLLCKVDHSVLWLLGDNAASIRNLRIEAAVRGVAPDRLVFALRMDLPDHLARHRLADLFLDTLPCNAHTTASDALWANLPLLTCLGATFAGRVAGSLLHAIGLPELVTDNLADYEALALKLATTPVMLSDLRAKLAKNRTTHPLFDTEKFTRHIESAYTSMYERWARGEVPGNITVQATATRAA